MTQVGDVISSLKAAIVAAVEELYREGLITPSGGNVSARCPNSDHILITASQIPKGTFTPDHILEVDSRGAMIAAAEADAEAPRPAGRLRPSVETGLHQAVYAARPDVGAVIHTHAPLATVWGLFDEPVPPLTIDCLRFTDVRVIPFATPGSNELATTAAEALTRSPAVLLRNHGLVTVGRGLSEAASVALALEETLKTVFLARLGQSLGLAGKEPAVIPQRAADFMRKVNLI